ncbi:MAG: sensor histidine kinase [Pseudooceanicola sp.]
MRGVSWPGTVSTRALMLLLSAILVMPGIVFLAFLQQDLEDDRKRLAWNGGQAVLEEVADRIEQEITSASTLADVFAKSGWLEEDNLAALHRRALSALRGTGLNLIVLDETGQQLLNTRVGFKEPLGLASDPKALAAARGEGAQLVSPFFHGRVAQQQVYNVTKVANFSDGRRRVLILTRDTDSLAPFTQAATAAGWFVELTDEADRPAFATGAARDVVTGLSCPAANGIVPEDTVVLTRELGFAPWRLCIWGSPNIYPGVLQGKGMLLGAGIVWLLLAVASATWLGRILSRDIRDTARLASSIVRGDVPPMKHSAVTEVDEIRTSLGDAAARIRDRDAERRMIMRETAHRAKNQMALAISLINLTSRNSGDVKEMRAQLVERLTSLGRSIDVAGASKSGVSSLRTIVESQLAAFCGEDLDKLTITGKTVMVDASPAQSLGLVFHELATNAYKHGAWSTPSGRVAVSWEVEDDQLRVTWSETGAQAAEPSRSGFGTTLLNTIVKMTLNGELEREFRPEGLLCRLTVPCASISVPDTDTAAAAK